MKYFKALICLVVCILRTTYSRHLNFDSGKASLYDKIDHDELDKLDELVKLDGVKKQDSGFDIENAKDKIIDGKMNGKTLTEGEINAILGYKGPEQILGTNSNNNNNDEANAKRTTLVQKAWPRASGKLFIPYVISDNYTATQRANIENAINRMNGYLSPCNTPTENVWKPRTTETNHIKFQIGEGCSSLVGFNAMNPQIITLADECISATGGVTLHEMLHAMSFYHEQERADRNQFVEILVDNIDGGSNNPDFSLQTDANALCTPYDYESIMHYGRKEFALDATMDTIRTLDASKQDVIGKRDNLSAGDILRVRRLYSCGETVPASCDPELCVDNSNVCSTYTSYCLLNNSWLKTNCAKTCGRCIKYVTKCTYRNTGATVPTPAPVPAGSCVDNHINCPTYTAFCSSNDWVKTNCRKSCNICSG